MFGLPPCSTHGCRFPGLFKVIFVESSGDVWAYLCPLCFVRLPGLLGEMGQVRQERKLLEKRKGPDDPE